MRPRWNKWLRRNGLGGKRAGDRSHARKQAQGGRRLALEPLESRTLLSVVTATNPNVAFSTTGRNMWDSDAADTISASFSKTLVDVDFGESFGGYVDVPLLGETGFQASFSGGFDLGFSGNFDVTGGEVDASYQTDITIDALTSLGASLTQDTDGTLINLAAGDSFILRSSGTVDAADAAAIAMETRFASIGAGLYLDYGLDLGASLVGKAFGDTVINTGFSKSVHNSVELIGADLNPGTGVGELRLLGGDSNAPIGQTWTITDGLEVSDPWGIVTATPYVPALDTGVTGDGYDDSDFNGSTIVNKHLPVDRSTGQTRIDFFSLGIDLDNIVTTALGLPELSVGVGNDYASLDVTLLDTDLEAYLGIAQEMTFDPNVMVRYNFSEAVAVRTPGFAVFETVTSISVPLGTDLEVIHTGGTLDIDTDYVMAGSFRNNTDVYLSPAFGLTVGSVQVEGSLVPDFGFSLYDNTFALGDPIRIAGLFDQTFDLGGFTEVDGADLELIAGDPIVFTVVATPDDSTITEGQDMVIHGTIFDPTSLATDGSDTYSLVIADWYDGTTAPQTLTLDANTTAADNGATYDPASRTFSVSHHYVEEIGTQSLSLTATRTTNTTQTGDMPVGIVVANAAPQVSLDPLYLDNDGNATLRGSYTDPGVLDSQTVSVTWGDTSWARFSLPAIGNLSVGQTIAGFSNPLVPNFIGGSLEVTSVDTATGEVGFEVTGKSYAGRVPSGPARVTVTDVDGGQGQASVPVPWGFGLTVLDSSVTAIDENSAARLDIRFTDDFVLDWDLVDGSDTVLVSQEYDIVVDWDDPNHPQDSTFHAAIEVIRGGNVAATTTNTSGDDAVLVLAEWPLTIASIPGTSKHLWTVTPTLSITRPYADDGSAAAGNGTTSDVSNVVVNIFDTSSPRGGTVIRPVTVSDVAPTVTLDPQGDVGLGGVAMLTGTIGDPGRLDEFELRVNWGDGTTFDNDGDPGTAADAYEVFTFPASPTGAQDFVVPHVYPKNDNTTNPDGISYTVTATAFDDDGLSGSATGAFEVDFDRPPVAFDDFFHTNADKTLTEALHGTVANLLVDNDWTVESAGDVDPEGDLDLTATALVANSFWIEYLNTTPPADAITVADVGLAINGDGTFTFDPTAAFNWLPDGTLARVYFDYQIADETGNTDTATARIWVDGVNAPPVITSLPTADVDENATAVLTVTATDADDPAQTVIFSISGGADQARFAIDGTTGALSFVTAPDYEVPTDIGGDNVYNVQVQANDQNGLTSTQDITVSVQPVNDNTPVITSPAAADVDENATAVLTVTATDDDLPSQTVIFSLSGGADQAKFTIDENTGALAFDTAPDYETPTDVGADNVYNVQVQADDQNGLTSTQDVTVTVQPLNDNAPVITSPAAASVDENTTAVLTVTATDADVPAQTVIFSLSGGADQAKFAIDANTGALSFVTAPDYEAPTDDGGDNVYNVQVQADDQDGLTSTQDITVTVLNEANVTGFVFADVDNDGMFDVEDAPLANVEITLTEAGVDEVFGTGDDEIFTTTTDNDGFYGFEDVAAGKVRIIESGPPADLADGVDTPNGATDLDAVNDQFTIDLDRTDVEDMNFAEQADGGGLSSGDTATIGYWHNKNGQALIEKLDEQGALTTWLLDNFGNIFDQADFAEHGGSVGGFYRDEFFKKKLKDTPKVDAQFMAVAFATFATSSNLSNGGAADFGFNVTDSGIGTTVVNVGSSGAAFRVPDNTDMTILALLRASNELTTEGADLIYDDGDNVLSDAEKSLRLLANTIYTNINEGGDL